MATCTTSHGEQGWWRWPGQQEAEGNEAQKLSEEDGAVEVLVSSIGASGGQAPEAVAESRRGWLRRLGQLQNIAASAASTVGGMGSFLPTSVHFGQTVAWPAVNPCLFQCLIYSYFHRNFDARFTLSRYQPLSPSVTICQQLWPSTKLRGEWRLVFCLCSCKTLLSLVAEISQPTCGCGKRCAQPFAGKSHHACISSSGIDTRQGYDRTWSRRV